MMRAPCACETRPWRSFGRLSESQLSAWFWAWSWDPPRFMRRHPPHHLSPAQANHPAGQDPEASLSRPKSPQQRSNRARKPVNSEQSCCSYAKGSSPQPNLVKLDGFHHPVSGRLRETGLDLHCVAHSLHEVCFWTQSRLSRPTLLTSVRTFGSARSGPLADLAMVVPAAGPHARACDQSIFSMRPGLLLMRRSAVAAGPIQQVT